MRKTVWAAGCLAVIVLCALLFVSAVFAEETKADTAKSLNARPLKIIPIGNLKVLGSWSDTDRASPLWGFDIAGSFSPALRLSKTQYIIPLYITASLSACGNTSRRKTAAGFTTPRRYIMPQLRGAAR